MSKKKFIVSLLLVALLTNLVQFGVQYFFNDRSQNKYESQIAALNSTLETIGPLVDAYTVRTQSFPGKQILQEDLVPIRVPESIISDSYLLDPISVVGKYYKIAIDPGTPITTDLIMQENIDDTAREIDITASSWTVGLKVGDFVDLRFVAPKGEDYVVLSHKRVHAVNADTVKVVLTERELYFYGASLIDWFLNKSAGADIYLTKYVEPGVQKPAKVFYNIPSNILSVLTVNPNILNKAIETGVDRELINSLIKNLNVEEAGALASGRTLYLSKLQAAKDAYDAATADSDFSGGIDLGEDGGLYVPGGGVDTSGSGGGVE